MNDLISRRQAIDAICEDGTQLERQGQYSMTMAERKQRDADILDALPSAQPQDIAQDIARIIENEKDMRVISKNAQPEIIRCKDCKHFWLGQCGLNGLTWSYDSFCSMAERREE